MTESTHPVRLVLTSREFAIGLQVLDAIADADPTVIGAHSPEAADESFRSTVERIRSELSALATTCADCVGDVSIDGYTLVPVNLALDDLRLIAMACKAYAVDLWAQVDDQDSPEAVEAAALMQELLMLANRLLDAA